MSRWTVAVLLGVGVAGPAVAEAASWAAVEQADPSPRLDATLNAVHRVADWQLAHPIGEEWKAIHPAGFNPDSWRAGVLYTAIGKLYRETRQPRYLDHLLAWGEGNGWDAGRRVYHADDQAVLRAYLYVYEELGDPAHFEPTLAAAESSFARVATEEPWLWHWSDALFMAAPAYAALGRITGDQKYLDFLDQQYALTVEKLYNPETKLFYRDERFKTMQDELGREIYWGRGNGWPFGATALTLDELPADHPQREMYEDVLVEMAERLAELQQPDGFWKASLLSPELYPDGETSATGFFCFGIAWGINHGLLDRATYGPVVDAAWAALNGAVNEEGRLGLCQPGGDRPVNPPADHHEYYGAAAFILAGLEMHEFYAEADAAEHAATHAARALPQAARVLGWQLNKARAENGPKPLDTRLGRDFWREGVLYTVLGRLHHETQDADSLAELIRWGDELGWQAGMMNHADDQAALRAYLYAYQHTGDAQHLAGSVASAKAVMDRAAEQGPAEPAWLWHWSDALFMAAPAYAALGRITGEAAYHEFLDEQFALTVGKLFNPETKLFYRDARFIPMRDEAGREIYWSRGNGWAMAAIALVLEELPADYANRALYERVFVAMAERLVELQQPDGFWKASLLSPALYPDGETSGTGFFCFGLAWGINHGLLDRATFGPAAEAAWRALNGAVDAEGRLGYCQLVGDRPSNPKPEHHELHGAAAFGLAGMAMRRFYASAADAQHAGRTEALPEFEVQFSTLGPAWTSTGVNTTPFRSHAVTTHEGVQFTGYYNPDQQVVLASRSLNHDAAPWRRQTTRFIGNATDAHNGISLAVDGAGYLHMSWDHHGHPLRYARGIASGRLEMGPPSAMIARTEKHVTYPQFLNLPDGRLIFMYRDGGSGNGNMVINRYDPAAESWTRLHDVLLDGEQERNAYWQSAVDPAGRVHVSWVWRETGNVATNHDVGYAVSHDGGETWAKSDGTPYAVPINQASAEYACRVPQAHELINQTSMTTDAAGRPYIASYWRAEGEDVPQLRLVFHDGDSWQQRQVGARTLAFRLGGLGSKFMPLSRPQVMVREASGGGPKVFVVFRDGERGNRVSVAMSSDAELRNWRTVDLGDASVGQWEPAYDHARWKASGRLDLFVQHVEQRDGGGVVENVGPRPAGILSWTPKPAAILVEPAE